MDLNFIKQEEPVEYELVLANEYEDPLYSQVNQSDFVVSFTHTLTKSLGKQHFKND